MHHHHHHGWGWGGPVFFPFGFGFGGGLFGDLLAGGLGYMLGRWQGRNQPYQGYPPYYQQGYYGNPPYQAPTQNPGAGADARLAQLQLLERLRASGALTEAEFEAEKQRILSGY